MRHYPARMRGQPQVLFNTGEIEIWPRGLLRARGNHDARVLARARHVLRRKRDGRYLAADLPEGVLPMVERLPREPGIGDALDLLRSEEHTSELQSREKRVCRLLLENIKN